MTEYSDSLRKLKKLKIFMFMVLYFQLLHFLH